MEFIKTRDCEASASATRSLRNQAISELRRFQHPFTDHFKDQAALALALGSRSATGLDRHHDDAGLLHPLMMVPALTRWTSRSLK